MVYLSQKSLWSLAGIVLSVAADSQYRSRSDLSPPKLNITIPAADANGTEYVFVTPYNGEIQQPGAYIYRKDGDLVWSSIGYYAGFVDNLHPTTYHGETVLQAYQGTIDHLHGEGWGQFVLLNHKYEHVVTATAANHRIPSIHEFNSINGETALIEIYIPTLANLSAYGGNSSQKWIGNGIFQEFNIETGELIFEWSALDHIDPADSLVALGSSTANSGLTSEHSWDFIHINSVDKNEEGDYLISSRHLSTIFKINGTDGSIIWRLGGNSSTFSHDFTFGFQHYARWISQSTDDEVEVISFFNNGGDGTITFNNVSSALVVQLNTTDSTAIILREATAPYGLQAASQGNAQLLPNGNFFVGWGSAGAYSEFNTDNEVIFHAFIEDGISYRSFAGNWTGISNETPAIVAFEDGTSNSTRLFVSWNGDTQTESWKFFTGHGRKRSLIAQVHRKSFETSFVWKNIDDSATFYVEAIGKDGHVLGKAGPVTTSNWIALSS
ncbi:hypothetical protein N7495_001903 [Penicillium taxi]|uniref:uncharacterized protein n=1 Tax=Penicillium taxi TaxID=168475 RepID=UPI002545275A|nr:uncharacterized protein N7495_001903 [Penicillium taxi]KAJ5909221.1 hypothetical protein N7495_001903 [Penicillium taxi]